MVILLYGYMVIWLYGYMVIWYGYVCSSISGIAVGFSVSDLLVHWMKKEDFYGGRTGPLEKFYLFIYFLLI